MEEALDRLIVSLISSMEKEDSTKLNAGALVMASMMVGEKTLGESCILI